jgi:ATP-binding protein involved in chromosome partitioning
MAIGPRLGYVDAMVPTAKEVLEALKQVKYPGFSRDIVSFGIVRDIEVGGFGTTITLAPPADAPDLVDRIRAEVVRAASALPDVGEITLVSAPPPSTTTAAPRSARSGAQGIPGVRNVVAVASGKGGVGKSTVAVNLALALARRHRVGLLDADVYGPSAPVMLGLEDAKPHVTRERRIVPLEAHGLRTVSMGFFVERERAVIWRGPMVTKLVVEFLRNVDWGELDYLVLDLPPGTGDVQLTLAQQLAMTGGVIVTTPQDVALADVRRGVRMFEQVKVPVLGVIENMSGHVCRSCGHETDVFGRGGGERMAAELGVPYLGALPLVTRVRDLADAGTPIVVTEPEHPVSLRLLEIAELIERGVRASSAA